MNKFDVRIMIGFGLWPLLPLALQVEALRQQQEAEQEGWRAAIAERARREVAEREAALRDRMARERDQQIEVGCPLVVCLFEVQKTRHIAWCGYQHEVCCVRC
jgi:hypothetical protein